jgi:hypothetical protein
MEEPHENANFQRYFHFPKALLQVFCMIIHEVNIQGFHREDPR